MTIGVTDAVAVPDASRSTSPPPSAGYGTGAVIGVPGGRAEATYARRRETFAKRRAAQLPAALVAAVLLAVIAFLVLQAYNLPLAILMAAVIALGLLVEVLVQPLPLLAWRTGAEGEVRTAEFLDPLAAEGFVILHDRRIPGSAANIDHLVIGPTGVFVIETKNIAGRVHIDGDQVRIGGRRVPVVAEVDREVAAVVTALAPLLGSLDLTVTPLICAHRADLPWFNRRVRGIPIVSGRGLVKAIRDSPARLTAEQVDGLARMAIVRLPA
jgi:hypothetical protein